MQLPLRRRAWLSREGWYYLAVLAFIVGGAVLRNVNLLVVLAGMMLAPLVLNWRMVMASLRGLTVRRKLPSHASAGQPFTVEVALTNHRSSFSSWLLRVSDRVVLDAEISSPRDRFSLRSPRTWKRLFQDPSVITPEAIVQQALAGVTTTASYRLTVHRRGRYRFGPLVVSTRYPLGLVRGHVQYPDMAELIVIPRIGRLTDRWTELTEADQLGDERRHPQRGFAEGDYYGLRPWQTGDSQRWIHWRTTAKLNSPTVRQFERQRSHDLAIVLDPWLPEGAQEDEIGRLELAISMTATALADIGKRGGTLAFAIAGSPPQLWQGPASPLFAEEILLALASVSGSSTADWLATFDSLGPLLVGDPALVISPRSQSAWQAELRKSSTDASIADTELKWVDVSSSDIGELYELD